MKTLSLLSLCLVLGACGDKDTTDDSSATDDTAAAEGNGLPEGSSTWEGNIELAGFNFFVDVTIANSGGDLTGSIAFEDDPSNPSGLGTGTFGFTGTHDPVSGLVGIAPDDWIVPNNNSELLGFYGSYDPSTDTISGTMVDAASRTDNTFRGGPGSFTRVSGDGARTTAGDGAKALSTDLRHWSGTFQCASAVRPIEGELQYDGNGGVTGWLTFAEEDLADPCCTHDIYGVHNPTTGGVTLFPTTYTDYFATDTNYSTNWYDLTYDPSDESMVGDVRVTRGGCRADQVMVSFD
ncbi:MAG: hypothetical protein H6739_32075 [Alphaproteobacteria bacterium]|nr:hypothetical protein [Alphaproteobacteria bacterium]